MSEENTKKSKGRGDASPLKDPAVRAKAREASSKSWTPERRAKARERMKEVQAMRKTPNTGEHLRPGTKEHLDKIRPKATAMHKAMQEEVWRSQNIEITEDLKDFTMAINASTSKGGQVIRKLLGQGITYADIANTMKSYADQGLLPLAVYFKTGQHYGFPYFTACHIRFWSKNHPEIKEADQYCKDRALLNNLEMLKRGAKLDVIKYINNICLKVYETSQIKADVNASVDVKGEIEVKVKTLADIRKTLGK